MSYWIYQHLGQPQPRRDPRRGHAGGARSSSSDGGRVPARLGAQIGGVHARARGLPVLVRPPAGRRRRSSSSTPATGGCSSRAIARWSTTTSGRGSCSSARPMPDTCSSGSSLPGVRPRRDSRPATLERTGLRRSVGSPRRSAWASEFAGASTSRTGRPSAARSMRSSTLLAELGQRRPTVRPPSTISVLSGDIHFSYHVAHPLSRPARRRRQPRPPDGQLADPQRAPAVRTQRRCVSRRRRPGALIARVLRRLRRAAGARGALAARPRPGLRQLRRAADVRRRRARFASSGRRPTTTARARARGCVRGRSRPVMSGGRVDACCGFGQVHTPGNRGSWKCTVERPTHAETARRADRKPRAARRRGRSDGPSVGWLLACYVVLTSVSGAAIGWMVVNCSRRHGDRPSRRAVRRLVRGTPNSDGSTIWSLAGSLLSETIGQDRRDARSSCLVLLLGCRRWLESAGRRRVADPRGDGVHHRDVYRRPSPARRRAARRFARRLELPVRTRGRRGMLRGDRRRRVLAHPKRWIRRSLSC